MVGISEVLQTVGAIIIFSLILLTSNRMILKNSTQEVETEAESIAMSLAQTIIEEAQEKAFDAKTADGDIPTKLPEKFSSCRPESGESRNNFNDFDDYDGYSKDFDTEFGNKSFEVNVEVAYVSPAHNFDINKGSKTIPTYYKKMRITVSSTYLKTDNQKIHLSYLRRYYKTAN